MPTPKPVAGSTLSPLTLAKLGGGEITLGGARDRWSLIVVYRGKHCGRCKKYLTLLNDMRQKWYDAGFDIAVVSADPRGKGPKPTATHSGGHSTPATACQRTRWPRLASMFPTR